MERLKASREAAVWSLVAYLHSSMERLKGTAPDTRTGRIFLFTFQYGEIKRLAACSRAVLYGYLHSSMERLKGTVSPMRVTWQAYLHSSMERLKVSTPPTGGYYLIKFTFQYGEIKRIDWGFAVDPFA